MNGESEKFKSPREVAEKLSVSKWTVYRWIWEGRVRSVKIGRSVRVPETEIARLIKEGAA